MRFKTILFLVLIALFGCQRSEKSNIIEIPEPRPYQKEVAIPKKNEVFTADNQFLGTEDSLIAMLKKRALYKIAELSKKESEFVCNCFIEQMRNTKDSDSIFLEGLNKCSALLKKQRKAQPDFYFYTKNGDFVGTKPTVKARIKKELKEAKVKSISGPVLDDVIDCLGKKYRNMTTKEIENHDTLLLECVIDNYPKETK
ncbi:hypothetical protein SAMN06265349_102395 [Flavobacterium resistens]|uniref:Lipoprotein n=1 Tax=Flavobacterium resistens TaxID=443612 RepID=A0A521CAY8_9FLAO|nr:hypothetical protein [Flavobacterium resistens]MRX66495.1 hypothetical protein [Flavobacterium resistens]SMO56554.1 hypothetical protein SAMN06265349_102395 [Flavobacterium resistens]